MGAHRRAGTAGGRRLTYLVGREERGLEASASVGASEYRPPSTRSGAVERFQEVDETGEVRALVVIHGEVGPCIET